MHTSGGNQDLVRCIVVPARCGVANMAQPQDLFGDVLHKKASDDMKILSGSLYEHAVSVQVSQRMIGSDSRFAMTELILLSYD